MKRVIADSLVAICTIVLASIYLIATYRLPTLVGVDPLGQRAFPAVIGIAALICGVVLAGNALHAYLQVHEQSDADEDTFAGSHPLAIGILSAWLLGYYLAFEWLGLVLATVPFLFALMSYFNRGRWLTNAAVAIVFPLTVEFMLWQMFGRAPAPGLLSF
jgi:putative tricarboxylic transport membrane protein